MRRAVRLRGMENEMTEKAQRQQLQPRGSSKRSCTSRCAALIGCCLLVGASRCWTSSNSVLSGRCHYPALGVAASLLQLNLKSRALSRLLQRRNGTSFAGVSSQLPDLSLDDILRVDVSGDLQVHMFGPSSEPATWIGRSAEDGGGDPAAGAAWRGTTVALIRGKPSWSQSSWVSSCWWVLPHWFVGLHYDFAASWYGATRVWSNCQWLVPLAFTAATTPSNPWLRRLVPRSLDVTVDQSIVDDTDRIGQVELRWPFSVEEGDCFYGGDGTSLTARLYSSGASSLSLQVPFHRRLHYQCKISSEWRESSGPPSPHGFDLPDSTALDEEAWWLPDVTLRANGRLESRNAAVFPHPHRPLDGRVGVRLVASRRLLWDDGASGVAEPSATSLYLEVQDFQEQAITGVRLQAELERPLESWRLAVVQQMYLPSVPPLGTVMGTHSRKGDGKVQ